MTPEGRWFTVAGPGIPAGQLLFAHRADAHCFAITRYFDALTRNQLPFTIADVRAHLGARDLACYCAPPLPCHVDVVLPIANSHGPVTRAVLAAALAPYRRD